MFRTFKYSVLHSTERKKTILEIKIKTRIIIKSKQKTKRRYGFRIK